MCLPHLRTVATLPCNGESSRLHTNNFSKQSHTLKLHKVKKYPSGLFKQLVCTWAYISHAAGVQNGFLSHPHTPEVSAIHQWRHPQCFATSRSKHQSSTASGRHVSNGRLAAAEYPDPPNFCRRRKSAGKIAVPLQKLRPTFSCVCHFD